MTTRLQRAHRDEEDQGKWELGNVHDAVGRRLTNGTKPDEY